MAARTRLIAGLTSVVGAVSLAGVVWAQVPESAKMPTAEQHTIEKLSAPSPHWVYILEPTFPHLIASNIWIFDGDTLGMKGMMNAGYTPNFEIAPDAKEMYVAETFWSRGTRGTRTDVVTFYNGQLEPTGEVELPKGRFLIVTKRNDTALTTDGHYLLSFNMAPATTVSVVDVKTRTYVGDIETPGCGLIYPMGPTRFAMLCADGSFLTVDFDANGNGKLTRGQPFFDAENDPVFEHAGFVRGKRQAWFVSYDGKVYPVDFSGATPRVSAPWSLTSGAEQGKWRPGGWQLTAYSPALNRLYVLMHQGGRWTHKELGEEVWVFDLGTKKRIGRIPLEEHGLSIAVSQDSKPLLFSISEKPNMSVFDGTTFEHKGDVEELGISPYVLYTIGQ
jgi:methylamine dehydrogenase heavy chain